MATDGEVLRELGELVRARDAVLMRVRVQETAIGLEAERLVRERGVAKRAVARVVGISPPQVDVLISRALEAIDNSGAQGEALTEAVPVVGRREALDLLGGAGHLRRVIAAFDRCDVLLGCGLDPEAFRDGDHVGIPNMLWYTDDDRWIGVEETTVGYGGTGPSNARAVLLDAGLGDERADYAKRYRFIDLDLDTGAERLEAGEVHQVRMPRFAHHVPGSALVVRFGLADLAGTLEHETWLESLPSRLLNDRDETAFEAWLAVADAEADRGGRPSAESRPWLFEGERVARVFTDPREARLQGFGGDDWHGGLGRSADTYDIVIEQGRMQWWLPTYPPEDPTQLLSEEAYRVLAEADLYPGELAERDLSAGRKLGRYLDHFVRRRRPAYFDVSRTGEGRLARVPFAPADA